jgi:hypothetical protein
MFDPLDSGLTRPGDQLSGVPADREPEEIEPLPPSVACCLTGMLFCQLCGRRLCGHWVHGRAGYRCRHGHTSAQVAEQDRRRNVYVRQDQVLMFLAAHVPQLRQPRPDLRPRVLTPPLLAGDTR